MTMMQARPTEWGGVRYRSKCEAMFARYLTFMPWAFEYEPKWLELDDGWRPDFVSVSFDQHEGRGAGRANFLMRVIEYKPSEPTNTYKDELLKRYAALSLGMQRPRVSYELWWGNFFDTPTMKNKFRSEMVGAAHIPDHWMYEEPWPFGMFYEDEDGIIEAILKTRFDLKDQP